MAVTVEPILKSQPDTAKLNTFSGHTVTVTKHTAPRNSVGQLVVPTTQMPLKQIMELQTSVPLSNGAGFYFFTVTDTGGTGEDKWMVRLGPDMQAQEGFSMGSVTPIGPSGPAGQPPAGEGVIHLGHGFFYNPELGTLTTPWRRVYNWKQGDPMPEQPSTTNAPAATPWWQQPQQGAPMPGGWGGYPVNDSSSDRVKALEAQLAEQTRRQEQAELRAEIRRVEEAAQRRADEAAARVEKLIEKLTAAPKGPSDEMLAMQRRLEESDHRREESERETRRQLEMREMNDKFERTIRDISANKQDPMLPMIMQLMTASQAQAQKTVEAIQTSTAVSASASERSTQALVQQLQNSVMTPTALFSLMQTAKGDGAEMGRMVLEATKETMSMQKAVYEQLLDVAGQNGQPAWLPLAQEALQRIGTVGAALAQRSAQQAAPAPTPRPRPAVQAAPQAPQLRPVTPPTPRTAEELRAQAAASVEHFQPSAAPMNGTSGVATPAPAAVVVQPSQVIPPPPPPPAPPPARAKRNGKKPVKRAKAASAPPAPLAPPAANPQGYTMAELRELDPDVVRDGMAQYTDEQLFTVLMPYVEQLRGGSPPAQEVASYILQGRQYCEQLRSAQPPTAMPPAMELLDAEQLEVLVERLLPAATEDFQDEVVEALEELMGLEVEDDEEEVATGPAS